MRGEDEAPASRFWESPASTLPLPPLYLTSDIDCSVGPEIGKDSTSRIWRYRCLWQVDAADFRYQFIEAGFVT
jgi:hypothetical protein